ncbi:A/G-specific adenine glycosylase [Methylobacterium currus]|uniref:A/G-specific adenine glycosylase n=1 Tax=Methylobacterium currus TaxID=2051553 RepID=UPI001E4D16BC|nr:A/G-specific adenine glycosylase [Methylobacterium currus]UHC18535.1 A/G-specific adenine glycosylase [Methylobacterium currus]
MVAPAASHLRPEAADLLVWYDRHRRALPWRALPGVAPDPYRVWLSEIMLQQTTVAAVKPYFARFLERFPTVEVLAAAPEDAVMGAWAGLGYYSRARNLHACAKAVAEAGGFPDTVEGLRKLPGIGAYTAGAIAAIAFDRPAAAVDGNVERVVSRLYAIETPIPAARPEIRRLAEEMVPQERPGDFAQAVMDLGATLCTPKRPACALCPWMQPCRARAEGLQETFPRKVKKVAGALRRGAAFVVLRAGDDAVLLRTRPPEGLLGSMAEPPTSEWRADYDPAQALLDAPLDARWKRLPGLVRHVFTHFPLELTVFLARVAAGTPAPEGMRFTPRAGLDAEPLPGAMKKVLAHVLEQKLAAPPAAAAPPPAPDLATLPEPEPPPRRAPLPKVLSRRPASAAPVVKSPGRGRPRTR